MDAIRLDEGRWELDELVDRVEAGESIDIMRGGRLVANVVPVEVRALPEPAQPMTDVEWKALLAEMRTFRASLPYDPSNSVEEMRREARY